MATRDSDLRLSAEELKELVRQAQARDPDARNALFAAFEPLVRGLIQRQVCTPEVCAELYGEAFLIFDDLLHRYDEQRGVDFPGYVKQMLGFGLANYIRGVVRRIEKELWTAGERSSAATCKVIRIRKSPGNSKSSGSALPRSDTGLCWS